MLRVSYNEQQPDIGLGTSWSLPLLASLKKVGHYHEQKQMSAAKPMPES